MKIKEKIMNLLNGGGKKTTYEIAKEIGVTWGTANTHLYALCAQGKLNHKRVHEKNQDKIYWWSK